MKKLYFSIILMLVAFVSAEAKVIYLSVNVVSPAANATLTVGQAFSEMVVVTNNGPNNLVTGDTFFYADPATPQGQVYYRINQNKNVGDTIQISKQITVGSGATNGAANYCVYAYVSNGTSITPDSVFSKCNAVTVAGGTNQGITTFNEVVKSSTMKIYPNPAVATANLDFSAQNNTEVVAHVFDVTGREVMSFNYGKAYQGQTGYQLNVAALTPGIYVVEMRQEGVKAVGRFNKN